MTNKDDAFLNQKEIAAVRKKEIEHEQEKQIQRDILKALDIIDARCKAEYDGVLGSLREWVPEPVQKSFIAARNRVIDTWEYEPHVAVEWLDRFVTIGTDKDEWFYPAVYPCGRELDPDYFTDTIGYLAHLRWAVSLGPENGIYILGGEFALQGYRNSKNLKPRSITTLTVLIDNTYKRLVDLKKGAPKAKEVLNALESYDSPSDPIIDEVDRQSETIFWNDQKGSPKTTGFRQFNNKVSEAKKRYFQDNG